MNIPDLMEEVVDHIKAPGKFATSDPQKAANNRPCVLVDLPTLDYDNGTLAGPLVQHKLVALASKTTGGPAALNELTGLIAHVSALLPVALARPLLYNLGGVNVPAYVLTVNLDQEATP